MQKDRKAVHKKVMKEIRRRNKELENDEYILGRFRIDMVIEQRNRFPDNSGVELFFILKISDKLTGNSGFFTTNSYDYDYKIFEYANDFIIRCSDGHFGHYPLLGYVAYDVHEVIPFIRRVNNVKKENGVIDKYNWLNFDVFN